MASNERISDLATAVGNDIRLLRNRLDKISPESSSESASESSGSFFGTNESSGSRDDLIIASEQTSNVNGLYRIVRDFSVKARPWTQAIRYFTKPDEAYDLTLVSRRVYGNPDEYITVMAAAGLDSVENGLSSKELILPMPSLLASMKRRVGYKNY